MVVWGGEVVGGGDVLKTEGFTVLVKYYYLKAHLPFVIHLLVFKYSDVLMFLLAFLRRCAPLCLREHNTQG